MFRPVYAMIFTTSIFRNSYPDEKYSETSLPTSQNSSNIQDDDVTSVHRCTLSILSKAQIQQVKDVNQNVTLYRHNSLVKAMYYMACSKILEIAPDLHVR